MKLINKKNIFRLIIVLTLFTAFPVFAKQYNTCGAFGEKTTSLIRLALNVIRIGAPILVVLLGALDFIKILISGEEKNYKEAWTSFLKRIGAVITLIFVPYIIVFVLKISGALSEYEISNNSVFCFFNF